MATMERTWKLFVYILLVFLAGSLGKDDDDQCGLYLAISSSTTAEKTIWGIYAGQEYEPGQTIGSPDLAVTSINLRANNLLDNRRSEEEQASLMKTLEILEESFWVGDAAGAKFELEEGRVIAAMSGNGFLGAYDLTLTNAEWSHKALYRRKRKGEERGVAHPNRGAISPFYDVTLNSAEKIKAGSEIFINYGSNWEAQEKKEELLKADFARLDDTIEQLIAFFDKHKANLDDSSKNDIYKFITKDVMQAAVGHKKSRKVQEILPINPDDLVNVKIAGGSLAYSQPSVFRSIDWLKQHGSCMDNIRSGPSTIPNAGRGAFATRKIKKGGLIAPSPMLHIPYKEVFDMHAIHHNEQGEAVRESDDIVGKQLTLNYCFGHPSSSMLLYPTGAVIGMINHSDKPNAKLVWSEHPSNQKVWFQLPPDQLVSKENAYLGLVMEVVATKDIQEGDEIFLDYGHEWRAAWKDHVSSWEKSLGNGEIAKDWPVKAVDLNDEYSTKPYATPDQLKKQPYPKNISLAAFIVVDESDEKGTLANPNKWSNPTGSTFMADNLFEVTVIDAVDVGGDAAVPFNYTIRWSNSNGEHTYVSGVPHDAFVFVDNPGTSDQFVVNAFRHYIGIPDDVFPKGPWRNV